MKKWIFIGLGAIVVILIVIVVDGIDLTVAWLRANGRLRAA